MSRERCRDEIPATVGIGLRAPHYREVVAGGAAPAGWLEVHSENFFCAGGQAMRFLEQARARHPMSLHGVGLSLGSAHGIDERHLARLVRLAARIEPGLVSEHLSWGAVPGRHLNDLLPLPYTAEALAVVCAHVDRTQEALGRPILVENVSSYLEFARADMPEWAFLAEVARRTGCGILLDVNNVYVSAVNHGFDPRAYLFGIPVGSVGEIHLAGHDVDGARLVDTHGRRVARPVWGLYREALRRFGRVPTLIEWDTDIPALPVLLDEAARARALMEGTDALAA